MSDETNSAAVEPEAVTTVAMVREEPQFPGGPVTADVHPDEVDNYLAENWAVAAPALTTATDGGEPVQQAGDDGLDAMTADQLRAYAVEHGLKVTHLPTVKPETLVKQIREGLAEKAQANG